MSDAAQIRTPLLKKDWKLELQYAFDGKRAAAIDRLGSLDEHLRVKIANSSDASQSRVELDEALEEILPGWRWQPATELYQTAMMLHVIRGFRPKRGGPKTVELVRSWGNAPSILEIYPGRTIDVRDLALKVLESYYSTARDESREWEVYTDLLYQLLRDKWHGAYALIRLRMFNAPALFEQTKMALSSDPGVLDRLVAQLLDSALPPAQDALTFLQTLCQFEQPSEFERAVERTGGTIRADEAEDPVIVTRKGRKIDIKPDDDEMVDSISMSAAHFDRGLEKYLPYHPPQRVGSGNGEPVPDEAS